MLIIPIKKKKGKGIFFFLVDLKGILWYNSKLKSYVQKERRKIR